MHSSTLSFGAGLETGNFAGSGKNSQRASPRADEEPAAKDQLIGIAARKTGEGTESQ